MEQGMAIALNQEQ